MLLGVVKSPRSARPVSIKLKKIDEHSDVAEGEDDELTDDTFLGKLMSHS
jgi:hypothetical protein